MKVVYLPEAEQELTDAAISLAESSGSIEIGERILQEAMFTEQRIAERPNSWPRAGSKFRRCLLSRFPYQIIYRVEGDSVRIYAFAHVKRRPGYWNKRLTR
ncbi:MAG: type II toxin-antitoxin system RelE/ParE family toxin [Hyphomicrobiaceae bacterium]